MPRKFACIEYVERLEEIPVKFKVIHKAPMKVFDWYVQRFNPYVIENLELLGESGYRVKLPMLEGEALANPEKMNDVLCRTIAMLRDYDVEIVSLPETCPTEVSSISVATGEQLLAFFIMDGIKKALKMMKKDLKHAEILILGDSELTSALIESIYPEVNFLSIMPEKDMEKYESIATDIFYDTGLNLQVMQMNKALLGSADIVINTSNSENKFDFHFKRGVVYFDFSRNKAKRIELLRKREDMLIIDGFTLKQEEEKIDLIALELALYVKSSAYRGIFLRGYDGRAATTVKNQCKHMEIRSAGFTQLHTVLNSNHFTRFLSRAGV